MVVEYEKGKDPAAVRKLLRSPAAWSPQPKRQSPPRRPAAAAVLPPAKAQQQTVLVEQQQPEFSPASEAKLEGSRERCATSSLSGVPGLTRRAVTSSQRGLIDASESLVLPLQLTGDRDTQVKPQFTVIVEMMG